MFVFGLPRNLLDCSRVGSSFYLVSPTDHQIILKTHALIQGKLVFVISIICNSSVIPPRHWQHAYLRKPELASTNSRKLCHSYSYGCSASYFPNSHGLHSQYHSYDFSPKTSLGLGPGTGISFKLIAPACAPADTLGSRKGGDEDLAQTVGVSLCEPAKAT